MIKYLRLSYVKDGIGLDKNYMNISMLRLLFVILFSYQLEHNIMFGGFNHLPRKSIISIRMSKNNNNR